MICNIHVLPSAAEVYIIGHVSSIFKVHIMLFFSLNQIRNADKYSMLISYILLSILFYKCHFCPTIFHLMQTKSVHMHDYQLKVSRLLKEILRLMLNVIFIVNNFGVV